MPVADTDSQSYGFLFAAIGVIAVVAVSTTVVSFVARCLTRRRHSRWIRTLKQEQIIELARLEREDKALERDLKHRVKSLFMSRETPLLVRYFIPFIILGNCALFLSGHLSLGGTVNISGNIGEQEFDVIGFYEFSMANSSKLVYRILSRFPPWQLLTSYFLSARNVGSQGLRARHNVSSRLWRMAILKAACDPLSVVFSSGVGIP
jgi:hypothetical protein